ncbi:FGGY family carbohydrate kinase [Flavobacterium faecale]|uniref:FGGY family carbohydrate kinase n=1 Tax=Flavobacterium faecale TaxID=1355330 RepID=UPI003AB0CF5F
MGKYIPALDQGTTSFRAFVFDKKKGNIVTVAQKEFKLYFSKPSWVEHDPNEIESTQAGVTTKAIAKKGLNVANIAAIRITNQQETVVVWYR